MGVVTRSVLRRSVLLAVVAAAVIASCSYDFDAAFSQTPAGSGGGVGGTGGTGGSACADLPGTPAKPVPADSATDVAATSVASLDWDDSTGATAYDVYLGHTCPPPAYPHTAFQQVATSELAGLSLDESTAYCWQVVAVGDEPGCDAVGPVWTFQTACDDAVPGPPSVTSSDAAYPPGTTSDSYTLTFSEPVTDLAASLSWSPIVGSGTMGEVNSVDASTYTVDFTGAADNDRYTLSVGVGVTDHCGAPLASQQDITLTIQNDGGLDCTPPADLHSAAYHVGPDDHDCWAWSADPQDTENDHPFACDTSVGGDVVVEYTTGPSQSTLNYDVHLANAQESNGYVGLEISEAPCSSGSTKYCTKTEPGVQVASGARPVSPSTTYYFWVCDAYGNHHRPDIDICLW